MEDDFGGEDFYGDAGGFDDDFDMDTGGDDMSWDEPADTWDDGDFGQDDNQGAPITDDQSS